MPLLTPFTPLLSNVTIYNTDFNTPFNALYNLVNNVGGAGIDSTNVLNLAGGNVNPGAFTGTFSFAGGLLSSTSAYWFLTTDSAAATTPSGGDLSIATSVSSGLLVLGSQASSVSIDFGVTTASQFTLPAGQAFSFPTPTAVTQGLGSAVPLFYVNGRSASSELQGCYRQRFLQRRLLRYCGYSQRKRCVYQFFSISLLQALRMLPILLGIVR